MPTHPKLVQILSKIFIQIPKIMKNPEIATVPSKFAADTVCASAPFLMSGAVALSHHCIHIMDDDLLCQGEDDSVSVSE